MPWFKRNYSNISQLISFCISSGIKASIDDEYKWAGVEDPKIMITTSRDPSSRLKMFAKVSLYTFTNTGHYVKWLKYCNLF